MPEARTTLAERVLQYLDDKGGSVTSSTGRGLTADMAAAVGANQGVLNGVLTRMEEAGTVTRDVRGRRTFAISAAGAPAVAPVTAPRPGRKRASVAAPTTKANQTKTPVERVAAAEVATPSPGIDRSHLDRALDELARLRDLVEAQKEASDGIVRRLDALETADRNRPSINGSKAETSPEGGMKLFRRRRA